MKTKTFLILIIGFLTMIVICYTIERFYAFPKHYKNIEILEMVEKTYKVGYQQGRIDVQKNYIDHHGMLMPNELNIIEENSIKRYNRDIDSIFSK